MRSIAFRRLQRNKAIKRTRTKWPWMTEENIQRSYQSRTLCSCPMCGNPRRHFGTKSVSEMRKEIRDKNKLKDMGL